ncbi:Protein MIZU-KUSSEI 1 [Bienertia sinuspersici]
MKTIMGNDTSFSLSRRYFNWRKKAEDVVNEEVDSSSHSFSSLVCNSKKLAVDDDRELEIKTCVLARKKSKKSKVSVSKLTSFFTKGRSGVGDVKCSLGSKVVGTVFGYRRGHVHIAFQEDPKNTPAFLIELSTPTSVLVREMASGLVRVALECDKKWDKKGMKLLEEPLWRAYCNGKKCGYAMRRECGPHEWRVLRSVGAITMGAGVLPDDDGDSNDKAEGELMYMRAKFERIVGSKDSVAFYMMNPDTNGVPAPGPELSVYLLRV